VEALGRAWCIHAHDGGAGNAELKTVMIDATYLKAHRTASSLRVK
jgi:hypothetical protein